jgi:hypothetical protein
MRCKALLPVLFAALAVRGGVPLAESQILSGTELFPVSPAVNDQRGFAIVMDGEWLALGARLEEVNGLKNAGAVHLFKLEQGTWKHKARVSSVAPQLNGQFGFAVALRDDSLAVGAPGGEGRAYIFVRQGNQWIWQTAATGPSNFGASVGIDEDWLVVGRDDPHGQSLSFVLLYPRMNGLLSTPLTFTGEPGERFGRSVALRGDTLAIGAPGADGSKGAAYVYKESDGAWERTVALEDPDGTEGDQLGFAVATNGQDVAVGAPTAGAANEGAAWVWSPEDGLTRLPGNAGAGAQLGYAVAIAGDRIAIGAPFEGADRLGSVHVFTRTAGIWSEPDPLLKAENADPLGLLGLSVAASGEWVMFGAALGDQGGGAAGSVSSFRCRPGAQCVPRGDVAVSGEAAQEVFGISVAADGDLFAVGARKLDASKGSVTLFRRSSRGWHQEERLPCPEERDDEFGAAVALHRDAEDGDLLVVGEPYGGAAGEEPPLFAGSVYLFRKEGEAWRLEAKLLPPSSNIRDEFGRSVATDGETVVVGAQRDAEGVQRGAAYAFTRLPDGTWTQAVELVAPIPPAAEYGTAVAVHGGTIAVGAPTAHAHGRVYVFAATSAGGWGTPAELVSLSPEEEFGAAVAFDGETLAVGAPLHDAPGLEEPTPNSTPTPTPTPVPIRDSGAVYLYQRSGASWNLVLSMPEGLSDPKPPQGANLGFGAAVALRGADLVVGAPVVDFVSVDIDQAFLFHRKGAREWGLVTSLDAIPRIPMNNSERAPVNDHFGTGVAIGKDFLVVTSPGVGGGDRILLLELDPDRGKETP